MKKTLIAALTLCLLCAAGLAASPGAGFYGTFIEAEATGGVWLGFPAQVYFDGAWHNKQIAPLIKVGVNVYLTDFFYLGPVFNLVPVYSYDNYYDDNSSGFIEVGAALGIRFIFSEVLALKVGAELGNRFTWGNYTRSQVDGVGVNLNVELQYNLGDVFLVINPGFLSQVAGSEEHGASYYFLSWAPIVFVNVGIAFNLMER
jgi:opacity protein-like surface antigen